jgi:recombinational DNA repair protein RecR
MTCEHLEHSKDGTSYCPLSQQRAHEFDKMRKRIEELQATLKKIYDCSFNEDGLCEVCQDSIKNIVKEEQYDK